MPFGKCNFFARYKWRVYSRTQRWNLFLHRSKLSKFIKIYIAALVWCSSVLDFVPISFWKNVLHFRIFATVILERRTLLRRRIILLLRPCTCNCGYEKQFYTSPRVKHGKAFDINRRLVYSMRSCGIGYNGLELFSHLMNMPSAIGLKGLWWYC